MADNEEKDKNSSYKVLISPNEIFICFFITLKKTLILKLLSFKVF